MDELTVESGNTASSSCSTAGARRSARQVRLRNRALGQSRTRTAAPPRRRLRARLTDADLAEAARTKILRPDAVAG